MFWSTILLLIVSGLLFRPWLSLFSNYRVARRIGLPIVINPFDTLHPLFFLFGDKIVALCKLLPFGLGQSVQRGQIMWTFEDKYRTHEHLGSAFTIVTPGQNHVFVADAGAIDSILTRSKEFGKQEEMYRIFDLIGPNVISAGGDNWQRQRRITTPPFNSRNASLVWSETVSQAGGLLQEWISRGAANEVETAEDTRALGLNVLLAAVIGQSHPFHEREMVPTAGHSMTHRDALGTILPNMMVSAFIPIIPYVPGWILSERVKQVGKAVEEHKRYLVEMVAHERMLMSESGGGNVVSGALMSALLRASKEAELAGEKGVVSKGGLTDEEVYGNLFVFIIAGHETTSSALAFAIPLLAAHPEWQDWLIEEIDQVLEPMGGLAEQLDYDKAFPRLKRCLALMHETLRLYMPIPSIYRYVKSLPAPLTINGKEHIIPPDTFVCTNTVAMQTMPHYWGSDSLAWRPDRWLSHPTNPAEKTAGSVSAQSSTAEAEFLKPIPGTYFAWSGGPRICPGKIFSQVEFVAVIARLFSTHRVLPVRARGETLQQARQRVAGAVADSHFNMVMKMRHPERAAVLWVER